MRCVKAKHDTKTKSAGVTLYNEKCEACLRKHLASRTDSNSKLFRIGYKESPEIWKKVSKVAVIKMTHK